MLHYRTTRRATTAHRRPHGEEGTTTAPAAVSATARADTTGGTFTRSLVMSPLSLLPGARSERAHWAEA